MKYLHIEFLFLFLFSIPVAKAQQNHYLYIQTENKQPFYVKLDKKIYSSTASGYIVMPKLKEGKYDLAIGFPKTEFMEQNIACTINDTDLGYLLKNFGNKGWGLFNLQTLNVIMAGNNEKIVSAEVVNKTDAFSTMLSNVVNDSTIRQSEVVKVEIKIEPVKEDGKISTDATSEKQSPALADVKPGIDNPKASQNKKDVSNDPVRSELEKPEVKPGEINIANNTRSNITRKLLNKNAEGTEMVFIDEAGDLKDTIRVFIPADRKPVARVEEKPKEIENSKEELKAESIKQENKIKEGDAKVTESYITIKKQEEIKPEVSKGKNEEELKSPLDKAVEPVAQKIAMINSDCKGTATDSDFLKLRKKLAAANSDDEMITNAKKMFKVKCFSVEQVKNLSVLFLKDAGKYSFFDMAYPFVSDSNNFSTLQNQLSDSYYISRFQAMIHH